jgi:SAM-dependent methyltransferase
MTSRHEAETNLENESIRYPEQPTPGSLEGAYDLLTSYGFARRYVGGKTVADVSRREVEHGLRLLAETAGSVTVLTDLPEVDKLDSAAYSASNVSRQRVSFTQLPFSEDYFDVVVAFGIVEDLQHPEDLVREIRRVLKRDGVLVVSALDKQSTDASGYGDADGQRGMYVTEFRELLEGHFVNVHLYRQGAVAGGFVTPASGTVNSASIESARFSLANTNLGTELPASRFLVAVCGDAEVLGQEGPPYLLLDHDRCVFNECEERTEDVRLLRDEIRQMQETEVQAFVDAVKAQQVMSTHLLIRDLLARYPIHAYNIVYGNIYAIRRKGAKDTIRGAFRRLLGLPRDSTPRTDNAGRNRS